MALNIIINKVSVAASFAAGATVATAVASGGTAPYVYSLATGGDKFAIDSSTGVVTAIAAMDITNIASFSVTATDSTTGTALTITSDVIYPPIQAAIRSKFDRTNVIYKITKDIDLGHGVLTIPEGCTLDFQGGSIINGTIVGNNTKIKAGLQRIFDIDITLNGTWIVNEAYPEWFGAIRNTDCTASFQSILNSPFKNIVLSSTYTISDTLYISQGTTIQGNSSWDLVWDKSPVIIQFTPTSFKSLFREKEHTSVNYISGVVIKNIAIKGNGINSQYCIELDNLADSTISNLLITQFNSGIKIKYWLNTLIEHCKLYINTESCIEFTGNNTTTVTVMKCYLSKSKWAVKISFNSVVESSFIDCIFESCTEGGCYIESHNNIQFYNPYVENIVSNVFKLGYEEVNNDPFAIGNVSVFGGNIGGTNNSNYPDNYVAFNIKRICNFVVNGAYIGRFNHLFDFTNVVVAKSVSIKDCNLSQISKNDLTQSLITSINNTYLGERVMNLTDMPNGNSVGAPSGLTNRNIGIPYFNTDYNRICWWNGTNWVDSDGYKIIQRLGATNERPKNLSYLHQGFQYYDTALKKYILWEGENWVNLDGTALA